MKNTERFSNRVQNYVKFRPHYPREIVPFLKDKIALTPEKIIADIGSGTGISSELFLANGNTVYGVEPNKEMRQAAEELFKNNKKFVSINGTAEQTTLADNSVDVIVAGQAFHWFDRKATKKEFQRIAKSQAHLVLIWYSRNMESLFQQEYEKLLLDYGTDYQGIDHRNVKEETIAEFYLPAHYCMKTFKQSQWFDFEGLKGRLLSCSYIPLEANAQYNEMIDRLKEIYAQYSDGNKIEFQYDYILYYGHFG